VPIPIPCPKCGKLERCEHMPPPPPAVIKMRRERRGQREVVVLEGFPTYTDLEALAGDIKRRCGTGGTVKGRAIEIQGDHRDALEGLLAERGFKSKRAGG
jgi:translation initiation factor 1